MAGRGPRKILPRSQELPQFNFKNKKWPKVGDKDGLEGQKQQDPLREKPTRNSKKLAQHPTTEIEKAEKFVQQNNKATTSKADETTPTMVPVKSANGVSSLGMISFAEMLKKEAKPLVKVEEKKTVRPPVKRMQPTKRDFRHDRSRTAAPADSSKRPPFKRNLNRISAETFAKIGRTTDDEKYVMGSETNSKNSAKASPHKRFELEVEFVGESKVDRDDVEIEFVEPVLTDQFVNKISAGTYRRIGHTEEDKYVMSARPQVSWSKIVEESKPPEQLVIKDIHDMIKEKVKRKEELTVTEREVLRQKRRDRRKREKESKRLLREEEMREKMRSNKGVKLGFISNDILQKVTGTPTAKQSSSTPAKQSNTTSSTAGARRNIKFLDEEYPDLGAKEKKRSEKVIREVRNSAGELIPENQDTGSEWETDHQEDNEATDEVEADQPQEESSQQQQPFSYSSALKQKKVVGINPKKAPADKAQKSSAKPEKVELATSCKKKVKTKSAIEIDLFTAITKKEPKSKKQTPVLGGKIQKEPEKQVRNQLDSSAPARKRGKEREGGKKKKTSSMKKIILAEKARKLAERQEAAARREKRIKDGVRLEPLPQTEFSLENATVTKQERNVQNLSEELIIQDLNNLKVEEIKEQEELKSISNPAQTSKTPSPLPPVVKGNEPNASEASPEDPGEKKPALTLEDRAKLNIHSKKYRDYCDQDLSKDLETYVANLMTDLIRFQDRQHAKDPLKAKIRRRYVVGLRETAKFIKVKKVQCVIMATDLDKISSEGGLDTAVDNIIRLSGEQNVPVVFCLGRYKLGRVCIRKVPVSCVAIMNQQGSDEHYKNMVELAAQLRESYAAKLKIEMENLDPPAPASSGAITTSQALTNSLVGNNVFKDEPAEFVPRPTSALRYSPGKEFYPRGYDHRQAGGGGGYEAPSPGFWGYKEQQAMMSAAYNGVYPSFNNLRYESYESYNPHHLQFHDHPPSQLPHYQQQPQPPYGQPTKKQLNPDKEAFIPAAFEHPSSPPPQSTTSPSPLHLHPTNPPSPQPPPPPHWQKVVDILKS